MIADYKLNSSAEFQVLFLDIRSFKNINDTLGHVLGDRVLQEVAERLIMGVRPSDMLARDTTDPAPALVSSRTARSSGATLNSAAAAKVTSNQKPSARASSASRS